MITLRAFGVTFGLYWAEINKVNRNFNSNVSLTLTMRDDITEINTKSLVSLISLFQMFITAIKVHFRNTTEVYMYVVLLKLGLAQL